MGPAVKALHWKPKEAELEKAQQKGALKAMENSDELSWFGPVCSSFACV